MRDWRFWLALWCAKAASVFMRWMGRSRSRLPARTALRLCPWFLKALQKPSVTVCVLGTEGKGSVCRFLQAALIADGQRAVVNTAESSTEIGVASVLLEATSWHGHFLADALILEVHTHHAAAIVPMLSPTYTVVTNLLYESFKTTDTPARVAELLNKAISKDTVLVVNGDDPLSLRLAPTMPRTTFGIAPHADAADRLGCLSDDAVDCPVCGGELQYDFRRFFQLGRVRCPHGDFVTPPPDAECVAADTDQKTITIRTADGDEVYPLPSGDVLDRYAFTAAVALCRTAQLCSKDALCRAVTDEHPDERPVTLLYVKEQSPVSCSRALRAVANTDRPTAVLLMTEHLADAIRSSENMLWLYETACERLHTDSVRHIVLTGARAADWRVRLLLCGIEDERLIPVRHAIDADRAFPLSSVQRVFILYNAQNADAAYTAYDRLMSRMSGREEVSL